MTLFIDLRLILVGIAIGIAVAAPVGPVNIMAIQRSFRHGFLSGLTAGAGAVVADVLFASAAAFGVTTVAHFVEDYSTTIQLVGGIVLIIFGLTTLRSHPHLVEGGEGSPGILTGFFTAFVMTITNPGAILGFVAIFGSLGSLAPAPGNYLGATGMVLGVLAGSLAWWIFISGLVSRIRHRMNDLWLERINHIAGTLLLLFGLVIFVRALWMLNLFTGLI
ncbi:MAG: LysE family transporter [Stappiaceae bacterium]